MTDLATAHAALADALDAALDWAIQNGASFADTARALDGVAMHDAIGAVKSVSSFADIRTIYTDALFENLLDFGLSSKGTRVTTYQNAIRKAMVEAFNSAFDAGYAESSGGPRTDADDEDAMYWLMERINAEYGFIGQMVQSLKQLRDQFRAGEATDEDVSDFVSARVDGYTNSLDNVYGIGKVYGKSNMMLTFDGDDGGKDACKPGQGCKKWKGQRHRAKWWIARGLIERYGNPNFECGRWDNCLHTFNDDKGNVVIR